MAQVQTNTKASAKSKFGAKGFADAPKGAPEPDKAAEKAGKHVSLVAIKKSALSLDVGPLVITELSKTNDKEVELHRLGEEIKAKRYDLLAKTTQAIKKAAEHDDTIDLSAAFAGDPKQMNALNDRLGLALGFREIVKTEADKSGIQWEKIVASKAVAKYFPMPGEDKEKPEYKRKETLRGNFLSMLKKCAQAAAGMIENEMTSRYDAKQGTLVISGPAVKKHFGQDNIALNEKKTRGEGDSEVELNEKPSFTALAAIGAEAHGVEVNRSSNTRGTGPKLAVAVAAPKTTGMSAEAAVVALSKTFITAVEKLSGKITPEVKVALEQTQNACEVKLANG